MGRFIESEGRVDLMILLLDGLRVRSWIDPRLPVDPVDPVATCMMVCRFDPSRGWRVFAVRLESTF
jgi:hypothetical protein